MATTYLTRTQSNTGSETKGTFSAWIKRSKLGSIQVLFSSKASSEFFAIEFDASDKFQANLQINGTDYLNLKTTRVLRDTSAWYNLVVAIDSTDSTQADRVKMYINGVRETSFSTNLNNVSSSLNMRINGSSQNPFIGSFEPTSAQDFDGSMSHIHWVDGTAYPASAFGSTDSTTGEWKINTSPSVTYGTNGFFILKDGNTITDSSPNSNNFSLGAGTLTKTEDCPDNNFATLNPLYVINASQMPTLTNGNTTGTSTSSGYSSGVSSIAPAGSGKYYSEHKLISGTGGWNTNTLVGYSPTPSIIPNAPHDSNFFYGVLADGGAKQGATSRSGYAGTWTTGDIIRLALDLDNNRLYVGKNAYWSDGSGNWDEANINAYLDLTASPAVAGDNWFMICGDKNTSTATWGNNFGNGYFGTTAVASAGTNASNNGVFEYDVPTGYTALSTKGLNL